MISYQVALPALLIWCVGLPLLGLYLVFKNRDSLMKPSVKVKYGFLFNGYNLPKAYLWEFIIILKKLVLIVATVFL